MPPRSYYNSPRPSDYLAFARAYFPDDAAAAEAFINQRSLPYIAGERELASYLGISQSLIRQILYKKPYHYRTFPIPKGDGSDRIISTPKTYLKVIQWWICDNILLRAHIHDAVHGFRVGRSYITNATSHLGANHILNVDIEKFFPSITVDMIAAVFDCLGYKDRGVQILSGLVSLAGEAPTGAPTSPAIGNLVLASFDREMANIASERSMRYTRYADDLTFSSVDWIDIDFLKLVTDVVGSHGFSINKGKTKFMGRGDRMEITGVVINDRPNMTREWRNWARGFVHRALQNPNDYRSEWQKVSGIYGTLRAFDPECIRPLTIRSKKALELLKPT